MRFGVLWDKCDYACRNLFLLFPGRRGEMPGHVCGCRGRGVAAFENINAPAKRGIDVLFPSRDVGIRGLFPLDGRRRFRRDVVSDAVHAFHLVDDIVGYLRKEVVRQARPIGRHGIGAGHGA